MTNRAYRPLLLSTILLALSPLPASAGYWFKVAADGLVAPQAPPEPPKVAAALLEKVSPLASTIDFGAVAVGTTGSQVVTLKNGAALNGNKLTVSASGMSGRFSVVANTCSDVPGQGTCAISLEYSPAAVGAATPVSLQLTPNEGVPLTLSVQGTGTGDPYWNYVTMLYRYDVNQSPFANSKTAFSSSYMNGGTYTATGKFGGGALFTGSNYMFGDTGAFYPTGPTPFAVESWVKLTGAPAVTANGTWQGATVFSREGDGSAITLYFARFSILAGAAPTHLCLQWENWMSSYRSAHVCALAPVSFNNWHHVAATYSGSGRVPLLFVDGVLLSGSGSNPTNLELGVTTWATGGLYLGYRNAANYNGFLTGVLDDTRFTVGVQRYTTSFKPPTVALPAY